MTQTMRERFYDKFQIADNGAILSVKKLNDYSEDLYNEYADDLEILDFIEQELKKEREEIVGVVTNLRIHPYADATPYQHSPDLSEFESGYFQAKQDIINTIKNRV